MSHDCQWPGCDKLASMGKVMRSTGKTIHSCITHMEDFDKQDKENRNDASE